MSNSPELKQGGYSEFEKYKAGVDKMDKDRQKQQEVSATPPQSPTDSHSEKSGENLGEENREGDRSDHQVAKVDEESSKSEVLPNQRLYDLLLELTAMVKTLDTKVEQLQSELKKLDRQQKDNATTQQAEILEIKETLGNQRAILQEELQREREERSQQQIDEERLANLIIKKWFNSITRAGEKLEDEPPLSTTSPAEVEKNPEKKQPSTKSTTEEENMPVIHQETQNDHAKPSDESKDEPPLFTTSSAEVEKNPEKKQPSTKSTTEEENIPVIHQEAQNDYAKPSDRSEDTVLAIEEEQLLKDYKENSALLSERATVVAEAKESIEGNRLGASQTILEENRRGKYWIIEQSGSEYLVPSSKIKINEFNRETVERLFECQGFDKEKSNNVFELLKPAKVHYLKKENQWQVTEKGILEFH